MTGNGCPVSGSQNVANCVSKGKSERYDCRNHIRVIQPIGDGSKLYLCGTNAHNPRDLVIYGNLSHLAPGEKFPGIGDGIAKCPFDPDDNATAVWVEHGNPGGLPGLYSGTVAEFTKADTVIFRTNLYNLTTGKSVHPFKRTIKYDSKWLDKPHFVGSYDIGDYVYFFFRESAVEYINCGKNIYSRVARVCKRDTGGKNILNKNWASFLKARLNCSIPGEFPFYFNEIQHVYKHPDDEKKFYAVFSTSTSNGLLGSAICSYSLSSINEVFSGKFKEQATSSSAWLPVLTSKVPEPRPGLCVNDTQTLPDSVLNFIRGHPLMDSAVSQDNAKPVFYKRDVTFTCLVVDIVEVEGIQYTVYYAGTIYNTIYYVGTSKFDSHSWIRWYPKTTPNPCSTSATSLLRVLLSTSLRWRGYSIRSTMREQDNAKPAFYNRDVTFTCLVVDIVEVEGIQYTVYYAGTMDGYVYKLVEWYDRLGEEHSNLVDIFEATVPDAVRAIEISSKHKSLYVSSDYVLRQFDLVMCKGRYANCLRCIQDPYCGWDRERGECKPNVNGLLQDVTNATPGICDNCKYFCYFKT
ncbi:hypothetical protein JTE90_015943 [Oedothorax gibbosus]|uniref:Semaphorin-2A n=1 Tax=Oedothorax gibbosus TaxID=931172 RepID=A0AAV6U169_9ARAC|nr:hypothetical protein JTE90_015943 [Oedothorax gibbosus]